MKERLRSNEKAIYRMINAALLTGMALFGAVDFLGTGGRLHLFTALAVIVVLTAMNFMAARGRVLCGVMLLCLLFAGMAVTGWAESLAFLRGFLPWLFGGEVPVPEIPVAMLASSGAMSTLPGTAPASLVAMPQGWIFGYGMLQSAMIAAICYAVQILFEKIPMLKRIFAALLSAGLLISMLLEWEIGHFAVVFLIAYLVLVCVEWIQSRWEKVRKEGSAREAHTLWIMPFLILYLILMAAMPTPEEPYDWMWAKNLYSRVEETFTTLTQNLKWGSREGFGIAFSGFSEEGDLAGDLRQDADEVMTIWVQPERWRHRPENLYLAGNVLDTFDGRGWSRERQGTEGETFLDTAHTLYAVRKANQEYQRDYLREVSLDIRYQDFNTSYVFAPLKTWKLETWDGKALDYQCQGEELRWQGQKGYGTEYSIQYFAMNLGRQEFDQFLEQTAERMWNQAQDQTKNQTQDWRRNQTQNQAQNQTLDHAVDQMQDYASGHMADDTSGHAAGQTLNPVSEAPDEEIWSGVLQECKRRNEYEFTAEDIEAYRQAIYRDYLGNTELSPQTESCLQEMTASAQTQIEKLRAIESSLAALSYTTRPGDLPEWVTGEREFLDFFLLESRQGYCTYFATAFVLLARAEGIPARYVQGYCVPVQEGGTLVYSSMAHAWPEAYLEGVGWIPFEPTPGYGTRRYTPWEPEQPRNHGEGAGELMLPDSDEGIPEGFGIAASPAPEADSTAEENPERPDPEDNTAARRRVLFRNLGLAMLAAMLICAAFWTLDGILYRHRYRKMDLEEKLRTQVLQNLELLRWFGLERKPWETLQELGERASQQPGLEGAGILKFLESYQHVIYGGKQAQEDMIQEAVQEKGKLLGQLKARRKWAYLYCCLKMHLMGIGDICPK